MPRGNPVRIMGIMLRRIGDMIVVFVEDEKGNEIEVIREYADGPISHNVSEHGILTRLQARGY